MADRGPPRRAAQAAWLRPQAALRGRWHLFMKIEVGQTSHIGMLRSENQDAMNFVEPSDQSLLRGKGCLLLVADGMGGAAGGKVASEMAATVIPETYFQSTQEPPDALKESFEAANLQLFQKSRQDPSLHGMGTTATAVAFLEDRLIWAHVGDTRLYRWRDHEFTLLTRDHSMVAQMVREGLLSEEEARHHPRRNVLMRSLGVSGNVAIDLQSDSTHPCDHYLLCTDGLHGLVEDREMARILEQCVPQAACDRLVALANERGGFDNVTVQVAHFTR